MKTRSISAGHQALSWLVLCLALTVNSPAKAQNQQRYYQTPPAYPAPPNAQPSPPPSYQYPQPAQRYAYPQQPQAQYESPIQFLPKFGKRMSEVVRRLFYGQDPTGWDNPPPGYGQGGYNLESNPRQQPVYPQPPPASAMPQQPGYQYSTRQGQAQPRYNYPPQAPSSSARPPSSQPAPKTTAPTTKSSTARPSSKYTPPKVTPPAPPKPAVTTKQPAQEPAESQPPSTRRSESTPRETTTTASTGSSGSFLKGRKTSKPGRVISPYPPYKELDITGLESGSLALDPTTQKVFEVP